MKPINRLNCVAAFVGFLLANQCLGQTPQPMRNPGFGQAGNSSPYGVYPAQYQQRVGKQVSTNQRRPARTSNGGIAALPWVERFIKPKTAQPTVDYDKVSVAGSQPPLSNVGSQQKPQSKATYGNVARQPQPIIARSPSPPVASRQPRVAQQQPTSSGRFSARFSDSDPSGGDVYPKPTPEPAVSRVNRGLVQSQPKSSLGIPRQPKPGQANLGSGSQFKNLVKQPPSVESLQSPRANSERTSPSEDKFLARLQEQSAPRVSRVPIKPKQPAPKAVAANPRAEQSQAEQSQATAMAPTPRPEEEGSLPSPTSIASDSVSREPVVLGNNGARRTISDLQETASEETVPEVPAKLVAAPRVEDAAKKNANAKLSGQFITSQLQRPASETEKPKPVDTQTVGGNANAPDLPLPTAEASVSLPEVLGANDSKGGVSEPTLPSKPSIAVPGQAKQTTESTEPNAIPSSPTLASPPNPLQPDLSVELPELPAELPKLPSEMPVLQGEQPLSPEPSDSGAKYLPKPSATAELPKLESPEPKLPTSTVPSDIPKLPKAMEPGPTKSGTSLPIPPGLAPLPKLDELPEGPSADERLNVESALPDPILPKQDLGNLSEETGSPKNLPRPGLATARIESPEGENQHPAPSSSGSKRNSEPEERIFGSLDKSNAFRVAPDQRMNMQSPGVQVLVNGPETIAVSTPSAYEIVAFNRDTVDLNGLMLRLEVPAGVQVQAAKNLFSIEKAPDGATLVTWGIEKLPAGEKAKATVNLTTRKDADFTIGLDWTLIPISRQAKVSVIAPALRVAVDGPKDVIYGKTNTYRVRILNEGKAAARDVQFQLAIPQMGAQQTDIGRIDPGKEEVLEYDLVFEQRGGTRLDAVASTSNGVKAVGQAEVLVRRQDLQVNLFAPELVYHGSAVNYRVNLKNRGDAMSQRTQASLQLPEGAKPVGLPYAAELKDSKLSWTVDPIAPGEGREYNFQLSLNAEGEHRVVFNCKDDADQPITTMATTVVQSIADLKLLVSDPTAPAPVGAEVTYELDLINRGSKAANNVRVVAQFSKGVEPIRADGHKYRLVPGQVFFEPIASVGPGQKIKLRVFATADNAGVHRFRAEVKSEDEAVRLVQEESTQYLKTKTQVARPAASSSPLR